MRMFKGVVGAMAAAGILAFLAGCGGSSTDTSVIGQVLDSRSNPIAGATVTVVSPVAGPTAKTDADGRFALKGMPAGQTVIIRCTKEGYVPDLSYPVPVIETQDSETKLTLIKVGTSQTVDTTTDNVVTHTRSDGIKASVHIAANSIVDTSGQPVASAVVDVTVIPIKPNAEECREAQIATRAAGDEKPGALLTTPAVAVEVRDAAGKDLKLDPMKPATIEFPVAADNDPGTSTTGLWAQKPLPELWVKEGDVTRDDTVNPPVYRAKVTHFSQFVSGTRADYPYTLVVQTMNNPSIPDNVMVPGAYVKAVDLTNGIVQVGTTGASGAVLFAMPGKKYTIRASKLGYTDRGVYSTQWVGNIANVVYWLQKIKTGGAGS